MFTTRSAATVAEPSTAPAGVRASTEVSAILILPGRARRSRCKLILTRRRKRGNLDGAEIDNPIERRESVLNARIAAFEATARRFANDEFIQRDQLRREQEERAKKLNETLRAREQAISKKNAELQAREQKLAEIFKDFEAREAALASRTDALRDREETFRRETGEQNYALDQKVTFLKDQEKRLSGIASGLESREALVATRLKEIMAREEQVGRVSIDTEVREQDFKRRDAAIQELQRKLRAESDQVAARDRQLQELASDLATRQSQLEFRESAFKAKAEELAFRESALSAREAKAKQYETTLSNRNKEITQMKAEIELRENECARRNAAFLAQRDELSQRSSALNLREAQLRRLYAESNNAQLKLLETKGQLDAKEKLFEERSRQAIEAIRRQKKMLIQMRQELERAVKNKRRR